jgi:hypothetical protein
MLNSNNPLYLPGSDPIIRLEKGFKSTSKRSYSRDLKNLYLQTCIVSGLTNKQTTIVVHHLYSCSTVPQLEYSMLNGIVLSTELHKTFHRLYSNNCTPLNFIQFVKLLEQKGFNSNRSEKVINWIKFLDCEMIKQL